MRIGLSYSRCIRDIVDSKVDINDVLVIIARTNFDPENDLHWKEIWEGYSIAEWGTFSSTDESRFREISIQLKKEGKLHQPRQFGAYPPGVQYYWLEASLVTEDLESNEAVKRAWENFKIISGLSGAEKFLNSDE